jgi:hypothetical protein
MICSPKHNLSSRRNNPQTIDRLYPVGYRAMFTVRRTDIFKDWLDGLKDRRAAARIRARVLRLEDGNLGDVKPVGGGVSELRTPSTISES